MIAFGRKTLELLLYGEQQIMMKDANIPMKKLLLVSLISECCLMIVFFGCFGSKIGLE